MNRVAPDENNLRSNKFLPSLHKFLGNDIERHYWIGFFSTMFVIY